MTKNKTFHPKGPDKTRVFVCFCLHFCFLTGVFPPKITWDLPPNTFPPRSAEPRLEVAPAIVSHHRGEGRRSLQVALQVGQRQNVLQRRCSNGEGRLKEGGCLFFLFFFCCFFQCCCKKGFCLRSFFKNFVKGCFSLRREFLFELFWQRELLYVFFWAKQFFVYVFFGKGSKRGLRKYKQLEEGKRPEKCLEMIKRKPLLGWSACAKDCFAYFRSLKLEWPVKSKPFFCNTT